MKPKTTYILAIILLGLIFHSCSAEPELTIEKRSYTGHKLKLNGYFRKEYTLDSTGYYSTWQLYFLYSNGVYSVTDWIDSARIETVEKELKNGNWYSSIKNNKTHWGRFTIDGSEIQLEEWNPGIFNSIHTCRDIGTILNDTTFELTSEWCSGNPNDREPLHFTCRFKEFGSKPDSTNAFTD